VVLAFAFFIVGGVLLADRYGPWAGRDIYTPGLAIGGIVTLLGIAIVGLAIAGRRSGGMTACAILAVVLGVLSFAGIDAVFITGTSAVVGETYWTPRGTISDNSVWKLGIGSATLDLSQIEVESPRQVYLELGIGRSRLILPDGVPAVVQADVGFGQVTSFLPDDWEVDNPDTGHSKYPTRSATRHLISPEMVTGALPLLLINVDIAAGELVISEGLLS
jgi:hypothetical protein